MMHVYEICPRKDKRGVNLISDALPFSPLWYAEPNAITNAIGYAKFFSRSHDAVIRVYDEAGYAIETHGHKGRVQRVVSFEIMMEREKREKQRSQKHSLK